MVKLRELYSTGLDSVSHLPGPLPELLGMIGVVVLAFLANFIAKKIIVRAVSGIAARSTTTIDDVLVEAGFFNRLAHLAPAFVLDALGPVALGNRPLLLLYLENATSIYLTIIGLMILASLLRAGEILVGRSKHANEIPVRGISQGIMLAASLVALIFILSALFGKSPLYFLSGLGALTAVLLLIFKDAILGFVAGIQISANRMVSIGDWIEMPKAGADGSVIEVNLTTVKVRNWDNTITTIPTYSLISDSFKNWRGMFDRGGRRIKRSIFIDMSSVRFADEAMLERWRKISLLRPYLDEKLREISEENDRRGIDLGVLGNGRRLTNLGTFRAYCLAYITADPRMHSDMLRIVRQMQPTEHGIPLEVYVFTTDTRWVYFEGIQSDLMEHLLAVIGEFGLRVFQTPSGHDVNRLIQAGTLSPGLPAEGPRGAPGISIESQE